MTRQLVIASALVAFLGTPVLAAEFYVAQNPADKKCEVTATKPDGTTLIMVGAANYATEDEAKAALAAAAECKQ